LPSLGSYNTLLLHFPGTLEASILDACTSCAIAPRLFDLSSTSKMKLCCFTLGSPKAPKKRPSLKSQVSSTEEDKKKATLAPVSTGWNDVKNTAVNGLLTALRVTKEAAAIFPPLQSAVGGLLVVAEVFQVCTNIRHATPSRHCVHSTVSINCRKHPPTGRISRRSQDILRNSIRRSPDRYRMTMSPVQRRSGSGLPTLTGML
jgi:hypothetical protein